MPGIQGAATAATPKSSEINVAPFQIRRFVIFKIVLNVLQSDIMWPYSRHFSLLDFVTIIL